MARFKLSFDSYIKSDKPTKSLINFLIKNCSLYFTINEKDSSCKNEWEPYLCSENDGITVSSSGNNKYRITFKKDELKCGDIVFIRGTIANEQGKSYSVNDEIYRISSELNVCITADDSTYTDFSNLQVYLLPNIASVTGNIRLNHYPVKSDYDICIPIYDDEISSLQTYKIYSMATSEELNCLSAVANTSISHLKIEFKKCKSKGNDEIKMSLHDGETLLGFTSWKESTPIYVSNLSEMQLYTGETNTKEKHYVYEYVHFFDFDDALDFSSLTNYESVVSMNFTDIEEHAHVLLPKDYSVNNESPFYNYDSQIKKSSTSLKLFDRFKNVYVPSSDDNSSISQQKSQTYDVLFAKVNESLNIPVTFDVYTSVKNPNDLIPYSEFAKSALSSPNNVNPICKIKLASKSNIDENRNISYQLRTTSFVIKYKDSNNISTNAPVYYKIGVCALDGTQKSTDVLVNEIKTSSMLTEEWIKSGENVIPIIALSKYVTNTLETTHPEYYYCVGKSITTNKTSMIKMHNIDYDISPDSYTYISVPYNALVPITKVNELTSTKELKGLMFLQLCNTDGTEITTDFMDVISLSTNIDGTSTEGTIKCFDLIDHCIEGGTFIPSREVCNVSLINDD